MIAVAVVPKENTQLSGLYRPGPMYCIQSKAQGFPRITFYPDLLDVMATFGRVQVEADAVRCPILLSNGNRLEKTLCGNGRHYAVKADPYSKPSYLFAIVAKDLAWTTGSYTTRPGGRKVKINVYSEQSNMKKCHYALGTLVGRGSLQARVQSRSLQHRHFHARHHRISE